MQLADLHAGGLGHEAAGQGWLGRARRLLDRVGPCVEHGWFEIALIACSRPNVDDLLESADRALEIALEYGDPDLEVRALADSGLALVSQGQVSEGFARLDEALAAITGGQLRDPSVAGVAFCSMLSSCDRSGDLRRAEEWNRLIDELVLERLGGRPRVLHTHCRVAYGSVLFRVGRWPEAEEVMLEALGPNGSRSIGHRIDNTARLAELRIDQGRIEEAAQLVGPHADELAMGNPMAADPPRCRGEHDLAVAVAGAGSGSSSVMPSGAGRCSRSRCRPSSAAATSTPPTAPPASWRCSPPGPTAPRSTAKRNWPVGGSRWRGVISPPPRRRWTKPGAASIGRSGRCSQRSPGSSGRSRWPTCGNRADAVVEGRAALGVLTRLGANPFADRAAALLRGLGDAARVRSVDTATAVGSLTRREAEVLALIRQGLTNREIGERLFISAKTAEHHVGRVLTKLGVKSRAEAAALATSAIVGAEIA